MSYDFDHQPQGLSDGAKIAIGCGAAAFICVALICGGAVMLGFRALDVAKEAAKDAMAQMEARQQELKKQSDDYAARFEAQGYQRVDSQILDVASVVKQPTVYTAQVLNLHADSEASIAVHAQMVDIRGTINGDLHLRCDVVNIHQDTVITGNLYLQQTGVVENEGTVQGEVIHVSEMADEDKKAGEPDAPLPNIKPPPGDVIETPSGAAADSKEADGEEEPQPDAEAPASETQEADNEAPTSEKSDVTPTGAQSSS